MRTWFGRSMASLLLGVCIACTQPPGESREDGAPQARGPSRDRNVNPPIGSTPYLLSTRVHYRGGGCRDQLSFTDDLYARVEVRDPELERRIDAVEQRIEALLGTSSTWADGELDELARREARSRIEPLSEDERHSLERLREAERAFDEKRDRDFRRLTGATENEIREFFEDPFFPYRRELAELEVRVPLSAAETTTLREGRELMDRSNRLKSERRWATDPVSLPVYENEQIFVGVYEEDLFRDDRCFSRTLRLNRRMLDEASLDLGALTLEFAAGP